MNLTTLKDDNTYFIIGRRFDNCTSEDIKKTFNVRLKRINTIIVDYEACFSFNSNELFSYTE